MGNLILLADNWFKGIYGVLLLLDAGVYWLVNNLYQTFIVISNVRIFSSSVFTEFANRIYAIIGIVMLFIIAFQLLGNIVDPDKMKSGDSSTGKIVKNIIISLALIVVFPTVFKLMYQVQDIVLGRSGPGGNVIANIILGPASSQGTDGNLNDGGRMVSTYVFSAFINVAGATDGPEVACQGSKLGFCHAYMDFITPGNPWYGDVAVFTSAETVDNNTVFKSTYFKQIYSEIDDGLVSYKFLISTLAGVFVAYLFLTFSLDMGIRVAKLAYFQLIAPIPIAFRILPKQKSVFDNWLKSLLSTYLDVFIRLMVVFFCVFLIGKLNNMWESIMNQSNYGESNWMVSSLAKIIVIFGIFAFMKEAPKMIAKMFGLEAGDFGLGIKDKLGKAALFGQGEPLSRENIARLNRNRILKKQSKSEGGTPMGRFVDRFGNNWGFGTREDRDNATDEAALRQIEAESQRERLDQRKANIDAFVSNRSTARDAADERIKRADNPNGITGAHTYTDSTGVTHTDMMSYSEMLAKYDSDTTSFDEKAQLQKDMYQLLESNRNQVINAELAKEKAAPGTGAAKIVSAMNNIENLEKNNAIGSSVTSSEYKGGTIIGAADAAKQMDDAFKDNVMKDQNSSGNGVSDKKRELDSRTAAVKSRKNSDERVAQRVDASTNKELKGPDKGKK